MQEIGRRESGILHKLYQRSSSYFDKSVGVEREFAAALEVAHDADGVLLREQSWFVHL
jgi:hypothetical protein